MRNAARSNIESLYALKQKLMVLKHAVDPLMEATGKLYGGRVPQVCAGMQEYFRDVYDHLHRIHATIEGIREMLTTAIQVNLGMISLSESEVTKKLAAWAAIIAGADDGRRHLRHELQAHAGARVGVRLSDLDRADGRDRHLSLRPVQEDALALTLQRVLVQAATGRSRSAAARRHAESRRPAAARASHVGLQRDVIDAEVVREHPLRRREHRAARPAPSASVRCADSATRSALICHTCRSCTSVTPGSAASARPTSS